MEDPTRRTGAPTPGDANALRVMRAQRSVDTRPELALRRALHSLGFRYRVNLPLHGMRRSRADLTFVPWRTAVFVQGCFRHACPRHLHAPRHNAEWWWEKLRQNVLRDQDTDAHLVRLGWIPLRIREHETVETAVAGVVEVLAHQGHPRASALGGSSPVHRRGIRGPAGPSSAC
ncbi:very short patch repair endonuclease [Kitasatospora sp. NPDC096147]|uniref:very short patch repair endonuclease n=1 Tax=Kitasatospora sp. NPDC096147 TaxID=3364093 RepID=UPI00381CADCF